MDSDRHVGAGAAFVLIAFGFFVDLIQGILNFLFIGIVLNPFISGFALLVFSVALPSAVLRKRALGLASTTILEFLPFIGSLPGWTIFAVRAVLTKRSQEHTQTASQSAPRWRL